MDRLTFEGNFCDISMCRENPCPYNGMCSQRQTWERLKQYEDAEQDGLLLVRPCKTGDKVLVDARTLPYNYLHPADGCGSFAKCEIVAIVTTKKETYLKLRALYPSRAGRRDYLKYGVTAIGKTVFLTSEEAETALTWKGDTQ